MAGLNRIQLIGHLGGDPEARSTPNGKQVVTFRLAVDRRWRGPDGQVNAATDWFNVEAWGRLGEVCQAYLSKGRLVFVEGRLQTDRYEKEGEPRQFTKVVAQKMQMLDRRAGDESAPEDEIEEPESLAVEA